MHAEQLMLLASQAKRKKKKNTKISKQSKKNIWIICIEKQFNRILLVAKK